MNVFIRIMGQLGVTIWLGIMGGIGAAAAYGGAGFWGAISEILLMLILGGFMEGLTYNLLKSEFGDAKCKQ